VIIGTAALAAEVRSTAARKAAKTVLRSDGISGRLSGLRLAETPRDTEQEQRAVEDEEAQEERRD
jgi:hypothetical protein